MGHLNLTSKTRQYPGQISFWTPRTFYVVALLAAFFAGISVASAQTVTDGCMQDIAGFSLNCTANDVKIAGVADIDGEPGPDIVILDDGCKFPGDTVNFTATFELQTTTERHDIGIYFATDGDSNGDGAVSGECSISTLPYTPDPPWLDLDGTNDDPLGLTQDECGDINDSHTPLYAEITLAGVVCIDPDEDGQLNLPNCISWRQPGANELCLSPLDSYPGTPSKCRCDIAFNVPIDVPPAELAVTKTADPTEVYEPGGDVTFNVQLTNNSIDPSNSVDLDTLVDDVYGDLLDPNNNNVFNNSCNSDELDMNIGAGETVSCTFTAQVLGNVSDSPQIDTVVASGWDQRDPPNQISGSDDASVAILDVAPTISVVKTANPIEVLEPGGNITFTVVVNNDSVATDSVTIDTLTDTIYGDLTSVENSTCSVPQIIPAAGNYTCSFTASVEGNAGYSETDIVTASGWDDENNPVSASDSATVNVNDVPSEIELIKTAYPISVDEPGDSVTFTFTVNNISTVDSVTINTLTDTIYGNLVGKGDCSMPQTIPAASSYTCSFTAYVAGDANTSETNVATASGLDDDNNPVIDNDDATVSFNNVPPAATLNKSVTGVVVTYEVKVTNNSMAESLSLDALVDDVYGDLLDPENNLVFNNTCLTFDRNIPVGETVLCTFDAEVTTSPHTDTVTGTVSDNDGSASITPSDTATVTFE